MLKVALSDKHRFKLSFKMVRRFTFHLENFCNEAEFPKILGETLLTLLLWRYLDQSVIRQQRSVKGGKMLVSLPKEQVLGQEETWP